MRCSRFIMALHVTEVFLRFVSGGILSFATIYWICKGFFFSCFQNELEKEHLVAFIWSLISVSLTFTESFQKDHKHTQTPKRIWVESSVQFLAGVALAHTYLNYSKESLVNCSCCLLNFIWESTQENRKMLQWETVFEMPQKKLQLQT